MTSPNDSTDPTVEGRKEARKGFIFLACAVAAAAALLITLAVIKGHTSPVSTASFQPLKAKTTQEHVLIEAPATTKTTAVPTAKVHIAAKVAGVDLSKCSGIAGLTTKDGKITVHYKDCAQLLWRTGNSTNNAIATAEGGAK